MANFSNSQAESTRDISEDQDDDEGMDDIKFIVVGQKCKNNQRLEKALRYFEMQIEYSDTGFEFLPEAGEYDTIFVLDNFSGNIYHQLHKSGARIMGPAVIIKCAENEERLPCNPRPLYSLTMQNLVLCFTGFKVKEELSRLAELVHHMGGSIRKDFSARVTHLVANCTGGQKYRVAVSMDTPVLLDEWIFKCWEARDDIPITATDSSLTRFKMSPFYFSVVSFLGFSKEEQRHMEEITVSNGGSCAEAGSPTCTHLVVDEHSIKQIPFETHSRMHIVKSEWFWGSIQMDACADESMYKFEEITDTPTTGKSGRTTPHTLSGGAKSRKRKRLRENLAQLAADADIDSPMFTTKRQSNEIAGMSFSASFLDATADTSQLPSQEGFSKENQLVSPQPTPAPIKNASARQLTAMELFQTEKNYVGILNVILKTFKAEIENPDQPGGPLLSATEVKRIFGKIPSLFEVHSKIRDELNELFINWTEESSIGDVMLNHTETLARVYPQFVNFFEDTKETLTFCDRNIPRFHAFLKKCLSKPECGRQSLAELLIRPVQRLPSVMLLLKDIMKRTEKNNPDIFSLERAIACLNEVITHINENKRKTEGHQMMFDIVNDIDNCPPNLLSSHRTFVSKLDVTELSDTLSGKGEPVSLFLFSDSLEMCKRRVKVLYSKSPAAHGAKTPQKAYKHLEMMQLSCIKKVVDIIETAECRNVFALVTRELNKKEKLYAFAILEDDLNKAEFLETLSKRISNATCRPDYENLLASLEASALQIDTSDLNKKPISSRLKRVSRAFSFNKTPRKLKRAMSSMSQVMSPFRRDSAVFVHPNTLTPRTTKNNLAAMRMATASTNDLTLQEEFQYSELIDQFSITSSPQSKRRETLAGIPSMTLQQGEKPSLWKETESPPLTSLPSTPNLLGTRYFGRQTMEPTSRKRLL